MLDIKTSNELIAILIFLITVWGGVYIVFGKHIRKKSITEKFYTDDYGKSNSIISNIIKDEKAMNFLEKLQKELDRARLNVKANSFVIFSFILALIFSTIGFIGFKGIFFAIILFGVGLIVPKIYVKSRRRSFIQKFDTEMVKALRRMAAVLRVGGSLDQSLQDVLDSQTIPNIVKYEFANVYASYKAGFSINQAFYEIYKSVGSKDTLYLCSAIDIQMETGGDKAEIIEGIANQITDRNLKQRSIKAKLGEIDASIKFLLVMPVVFSAILLKFNPTHFDFFRSSFLGELIGFFIVSMMVGGYFIMKKMSRVDI